MEYLLGSMIIYIYLNTFIQFNKIKGYSIFNFPKTHFSTYSESLNISKPYVKNSIPISVLFLEL